MKVGVEYTQSKAKMIPKGTDDWIDGGFKYFLSSPLFGEDSHFD